MTDFRTGKSLPGRICGEDALRDGVAGDEATMALEEEKERDRWYEGVFAPERESEGDVEMGEYVGGEVIISLLFGCIGIAINEGFARESIC
jgi:hypothetical protein